jgi:hypothetical protein
MVQHEIIRVDATKMLKNVSAQPYYRGDLIFAEDARGQYLIVSQSISGIALALDKVCNQTVSVTSLYESARRELRRGRTGGCWNVLRLPRDEAIAHYNAQRGKYARRVVAAWRPSAWEFE